MVETLDQKVDDMRTKGWKVSERNSERAVMTKNNGGYGGFWYHVLIAALTAWWSFGIGNVVYAYQYHKRFKQTEVVRA